MSRRLAVFTVSALAIFYFVASFLILLHQKITFGVWFQISDVLHHENIALIFLALGVGIIIGVSIFLILEPSRTLKKT